MKREGEIKSREALDDVLVQESFKELNSILQKEPPLDFCSISDPIFVSLRQISRFTDLLFFYPEDLLPKITDHEKIKEICHYSKVRYRRVSLVGKWWKEDSLALLAFYQELPVALINKKGSGYEMISPSGKTETVDEKNAPFFAKTAYTFYEPFPEGELTGFSVLKFAVKKRKKEILSIINIGILGALVSLIPPFFYKVLFDRVILAYDSTLLGQIIIGLTVIALSNLAFMLTRSLVFLRLMQLVDLKIESALWDRLLALTVNFFRQFTVGNLIQRIYAVSQIREELGGNVIKVILSGFFAFFYFFAMIAYSKTLALLGMGVTLFCLIITSICVVVKVALQRKILKSDGHVRGILVQLISGIAKLRVGAAENRAFAYWEKPFFQFLRLKFEAQKYQNIVSTITTLLPILSNAVLFTAILGMLSKDQALTLSIGSVMAFLAAYTPFSRSIFDFCSTGINMANLLPLWERAEVILHAKPETSLSKIRPGKLDGALCIDHISFRYNKETPLILQDVSIHADPGEYIAIVGQSGSGKSTLVRLLLGFETPESGCIYYSHKDLAELDLVDVRRQIGSVLQNSTLFFGSIYENIVCGGIYPKEEVQRAIRLSGLEEYINSLPMGVHTIVQSGGVGFSGGEIQRILISRALIANPAILLFDEATSALDNKTQESVSSNLEKLHLTRIVIAHRLSTIKNAQRVYVIEKGKVTQVGTPQELGEQEGLYHEMLRRQSSGMDQD
ncbi:MAG: NHLP bacteriocin export ABC transporter permease/ATPase subunit [Chlamydiota bacterium]